MDEIGQNPQYIAKLHALYLEKTTNLMGLLRLVDAANNDPANDNGKKLKDIAIFMGKKDPVLAIKALCTKVIQICTYISTREKLARDISSCIDQYESKRGEIMEIVHGSMDGEYPLQVASELLKDVRKIDRDVKVKAKF